MKILDEFKKFALKGNAIDLAVGVVIGAAFGTIVTSLVKDIINPPLALLLGGIDFSDKVIVLKVATESVEAITLNYGSFINSLINFVIISFAIFIVIKQMNRLNDKEEKKPTVKDSKEVVLLTEIRDSLRNQ
jgi:large conductance mechanosensitive channel